MKIVDANIILRYLLKDIEDQYKVASNILEQEIIFIPELIVAEVVYVLEKVYEVKRDEIRDSIVGLFTYPNIISEDIERLNCALGFYKEYNIDFADSILLGYNKENDFKIDTFDKQLNKLLD
jgi:predicted nucleic-acid-binding protein